MDQPQALQKDRSSRDISSTTATPQKSLRSEGGETNSAQPNRRDTTRPATSKSKNYRARLSWSDNSNARSTTSSTSNDDDIGNTKGLGTDASWWRNLSTSNGRKTWGSRFSWSDSSPSKTSVTSISEDDGVPLARKDPSKPGQKTGLPIRHSRTTATLKSFGKRLSWTEMKRKKSKETLRPKTESSEPGRGQQSEPTSEPRLSTARRFSNLRDRSFLGSRRSSGGVGMNRAPETTVPEPPESTVAADLPDGTDASPQAVPGASTKREPVGVGRSQPSFKRHSWAGPNQKIEETFNGDASVSDESSSQIQRVIIRKPLAADRPHSITQYSWSKINEERDRTLSILEEGRPFSSDKGPSNAATVGTSSRSSASEKLEAFKKRHSLSDYQQLRGRPDAVSSKFNANPARTWSPGVRSRRPSPPRRTSTSEKVRSFSKRLSLPNNIWGSSFESGTGLDDDDDPTTTKIISSETLQLRRSSMVPLPTLPPQPAHMIPQSSPLLSLPTELLHLLPPYLPASAVVALRQTSSRLHTILGLLPHSSSSSLSPSSTFTFLLMLDRDNLKAHAPSKSPRLLCGQCRRFHPRSAFPTAHASLHPLQRSCRQLWLCPHKSYTHPRAAKFLRPPPDSNTLFITKNIDPCPRCRDSIRHRVAADPTNTILTTKIALLQRPTPLPKRGQAPDVFPVKDVSAALQVLNFQMCPHIRISDHQLLSRFCRVCLSTRSVKANGRCIQDCNSERLNATGYSGGKCKGQCFKKGCNTGWMFQTRESLKPDASGRRQVWLVLAIWRGLGTLKVPDDDDTGAAEEIFWDPEEETNDEKKVTLPELSSSRSKGERFPAWIDHTVDAPERAAMRKQWEQWNRGVGGGGKCLPDWGATLLLSEDGSFGFGMN